MPPREHRPVDRVQFPFQRSVALCRRVCPAITEHVSHECHTDAIEYRRSGIDYARATDRNRRRRLCPRSYFLLGTAHSYSDNRTAKMPVTRRVPMGISHDIAGISSPAIAINSGHGKIFIAPEEPGKRRSHNDTAGTCAFSYNAGARGLYAGQYGQLRILWIRQTKNVLLVSACDFLILKTSVRMRH